MTHFVLIGLAGLAGSFHCLGMCGGFAVALAPSTRGRWGTVGRHLLYNTGRVTTYVFLGALSGILGSLVTHGPVAGAQRVLAIVSGLLMLIIGLQFFGILGRLHISTPGVVGEALVRALRGLLSAPGWSAPLAFGVFNGLLPCPLVYAFLAQAAATGDPISGMLTMAAFGAGTYPAMFGAGGVGSLLRPTWRRAGVRLAGAFVIAFGLITLVRGIGPFGHMG